MKAFFRKRKCALFITELTKRCFGSRRKKYFGAERSNLSVQAQSTVKKGRKSCCGRAVNFTAADFPISGCVLPEHTTKATAHDWRRLQRNTESGINMNYSASVRMWISCLNVPILYLCAPNSKRSGASRWRVCFRAPWSSARIRAAPPRFCRMEKRDICTGRAMQRAFVLLSKKQCKTETPRQRLRPAAAIMPSRILPHGTTPSRLRKCIKSYARRGKFPSRQSS